MAYTDFYAVRVVVRNTETGESFQRDYVRSQRMTRARFTAYAIGDFLQVTDTLGQPVRVTVEEVDFTTVQQNRLYHHTTHH